MNEKLRNEIDFNLQARQTFKTLLDSLKKHKDLVDVDIDLISLKLMTMDATYDDFCLYLVKLLNDGYFTKEELEHINKAIDRELFYDDSEELALEIRTMTEKIDVNNIENSIQKLKTKCKDIYEQYILQRAAFNFDVITEIDE